MNLPTGRLRAIAVLTRDKTKKITYSSIFLMQKNLSKKNFVKIKFVAFATLVVLKSHFLCSHDTANRDRVGNLIFKP